MLTGSIQTTRDSCSEYSSSFGRFEWLWKDVIADCYTEFNAKQPTLDEFEAKLRSPPRETTARFRAGEDAVKASLGSGERVTLCNSVYGLY